MASACHLADPTCNQAGEWGDGVEVDAVEVDAVEVDGVEVDAVKVKDSRRLILALSVSTTLGNWIN